MSKEYRNLLKGLQRRGWRLKRSRKHCMAFPPGGGSPVVIPHSPSDCMHGLRNMMAQIRRAERTCQEPVKGD